MYCNCSLHLECQPRQQDRKLGISKSRYLLIGVVHFVQDQAVAKALAFLLALEAHGLTIFPVLWTQYLEQGANSQTAIATHCRSNLLLFHLEEQHGTSQ